MAADKFKNKEIVTTGFYGARVISEEELDIMKAKLRRELAKLEVM